MARYLQTAAKLRTAIERFSKRLQLSDEDVAEIGMIANLAVRCCPRACQSTVRRNIIAEAVKGRCKVTMTQVTDERTGYTFNAIGITPNSLGKSLTETADSAEGSEES